MTLHAAPEGADRRDRRAATEHARKPSAEPADGPPVSEGFPSRPRPRGLPPARRDEVRASFKTLAGDVLLTLAEVAALCGVSVASASRWRSEGSLPEAVKIKGAVRFRVRDIRTWLGSL